MTNQVQGSVTTDVGQSERALAALRARIDDIERSTRKATRAARDYQAETSKAFNWGKAGQQGGQVAARAGGPGGSAIGRTLGGAGMDGIFGRMAVGVGLVSMGFKALTVVTDHLIDMQRGAVLAAQEMTKAMDRGADTLKGQALGALSQTQAQAALVAAGGQGAVQTADKLASNGILDPTAAATLTAKAYQRLPTFERDRALSAAESIAGAGGDANGALDRIIGSKRYQRMLKDPNRSDELVGRLYADETGTRYNPGTAGTLRYTRRQSDFLGAAKKTQGILGQEAAVGRDQLVANGPDAAREQLARFAAPIAAAILELNRTRQLEIDVLAKMAEAQGSVAAAIANLGLAFGGSGSVQQQVNAKQIQYAEYE